jgi:hypothetical protein
MTNESERIVLQRWVDFDPRFDKPRNISECPIAKAINKSNPMIRWVNVRSDTISYTHMGMRKRFVFQTPPKAADFIHDVDHGNRARGFMLVLRVKDIIQVTRLGPPLRQHVIQHDGRGAGPRGPRLRPIQIALVAGLTDSTSPVYNGVMNRTRGKEVKHDL